MRKKFSFPQLAVCLFLSVLILFSSCENFLEQDDFRDKLEKEIDYINSKNYKILISGDKSSGSFLYSGEKSCKVGDSFELKYNVSSATHKFINLEAVSSKDFSGRNDYVLFELNKYESSEEEGLYVFKVKLLKGANDILIRPVCFELPVLLSYSPDSSNFNYANSPIEMRFNIAMEAPDTKESETLFNWDNISITYMNEDIRRLFDIPFFDSQKKILTINPRTEQLCEYLGSVSYADIQITLSDKIFVKESAFQKEYQLFLKKTSFKVRIKSQIENELPLLREVLLTRKELSFETVDNLSEEDIFFPELFSVEGSAIDSEKVLKNRTSKSLYIYASAYDADSGIKKLRISERRTHTLKAGQEAEEPHIKDYNIGDNGIESKINSDGSAYFCLEHNLLSSDGAIEISVSAVDGAGNVSQGQSFVVIKKSSISLKQSGDWELYNGGFDNFSSYKTDSESLFDKDEYNSKLKTLYFRADYTENDDDLGSLYEEIFITEKLTPLCQYKDSNGNLIEQKFLPYPADDPETLYWSIELNVEEVQGLELSFSVSDDMGNSDKILLSIPTNDKIVYLVKENQGSFDLEFYSTDIHSLKELIFVKSGGENSDTGKKIINWKGKFSDSGVSSDFEYKLCPCFYAADVGAYFYVEYPEDSICTLPEEIESLDYEVEITEIKIEKPAEGNNYLEIKVFFEEDTWDLFDVVFVDFTLPNTVAKRVFAQKGEPYVVITCDTSDLYKSNGSCIVYGLKNNVQSAGYETIIPKVSGTDYDNVPPFFIKNYTKMFIGHEEYITFSVADYGSGVDYATVSLNGKEYRFTSSLNLYYYDIYLEPDKSYNADYFVKDKAENEYYASQAINNQEDAITEINKTETDTYKMFYKHSGSFRYSKNDYLLIYSLSNEGSWTKFDDTSFHNLTVEKSSSIAGGFICTFDKNQNLPQDSYVKVIHGNGDGYSYPIYFFTGASSSGKYDLITANGSSKSSVGISSDAPVFVHTVVTGLDYEICKDWTVQEWEYYKKSLGTAFLDFSSDDHSAQKYNIPLASIKSGESYCVVAHFADGTVEKSQVMVK